MTTNHQRSLGGIAPYGYRWKKGSLEVDDTEAPVRKLIYELFLKHSRKKTVAKILNELGYRTRNSSLFSDTTIDRLLRDTTAKGIREHSKGTVKVPAIISNELWDQVQKLLGGKKPGKQTAHLFSGIAICQCGGKLSVPGKSTKYVCPNCNLKILADDLELIFASQLASLNLFDDQDLLLSWEYLTFREKRNVIEQICVRLTVERRSIHIEYSYSPEFLIAATNGQHNTSGNKTESTLLPFDNVSRFDEPLLSETEAARFLGISKMTLNRKRNAGTIGFFRVGHRVLYSRSNHLIPFLKTCEKR